MTNIARKLLECGAPPVLLQKVEKETERVNDLDQLEEFKQIKKLWWPKKMNPTQMLEELKKDKIRNPEQYYRMVGLFRKYGENDWLKELGEAWVIG